MVSTLLTWQLVKSLPEACSKARAACLYPYIQWADELSFQRYKKCLTSSSKSSHSNVKTYAMFQAFSRKIPLLVLCSFSYLLHSRLPRVKFARGMIATELTGCLLALDVSFKPREGNTALPCPKCGGSVAQSFDDGYFVTMYHDAQSRVSYDVRLAYTF